jgi:CobQ-like glutamine amidotransferase family enzyme
VTNVVIASVFPELLSTYGDTGNVQVLEQRLRWRGISVDVLNVPVTAPLPALADLYVMGGGEDDHQALALERLRRSPLRAAVNRGAFVFGVCAGLQLLGTSLVARDGRIEQGLSVLDVRTSRREGRVLGEVVADFPIVTGLPPLTGFTNHSGATVLDPGAQPLATTRIGRGNDGSERSAEGAVQGTVIGTYLHGPVLARNPAFADWILGRVLGQRLDALADDPSVRLHDDLVRAASRRR